MQKKLASILALSASVANASIFNLLGFYSSHPQEAQQVQEQIKAHNMLLEKSSKERVAEKSSSLEPINPFTSSIPRNQLLHLEYYPVGVYRFSGETEEDFFAKQRARKNISTNNKIDFGRHIGISLYNSNFLGRPYEINIMLDGVNVKSYKGTVGTEGPIKGLGDVAVYTIDSVIYHNDASGNQRVNETETITLEAKILDDGAVICSDKRDVIVDIPKISD